MREGTNLKIKLKLLISMVIALILKFESRVIRYRLDIDLMILHFLLIFRILGQTFKFGS